MMSIADSAGRTAPPELDDDLVRYDRPLLADERAQAALRRAGYHLHGVVLDPEQVEEVRQVAADFLARLDEPWGEQFLTVGRVLDPELRAEISRRTAELVLPALTPLFVADARLRGSALQIKPPSERSELNCHQDSSLVDERTWLGVYAWIALDDTGPGNGGLEVLPGSHRFGNLQRTLNVPWQLAPYGDIMAAHSVPLEVRAGELVLFDAATVHRSRPNLSDRIRLATNAFATHRDAPMLHFFQDGSTTPGTVEVYEIDDSFFSDDDIMARPGPRHRCLGEWPQHRIEWTAEEFDQLCTRASVEADDVP